MKNAYATFAQRVRRTPQSEPMNDRQAKNNAGGYVFTLDPFKALERFLILGSEGGTYYVGERKLTQDAARNTIKAIETDGRRAVDLIVDISDKGRAAKNDPALFALALAAATNDPATRRYALDNLPRVARIPTHLFHFLDYVEGMRGWGRGLRRSIGNWYNEQAADRLAYQVTKYQSRDGWSNKDAIILAHPRYKTAVHAAVYNWIIKGKEGITEVTPAIILAFHEAQATTSPKRMAELVRQHNLSREMVPTPMLNEKVVWEALLEKMPMTALIRNLGNLSKVGLLEPLSDLQNKVMQQVTDPVQLQKARVHPLTILTAMKTYAQGHGMRGSASWPVNQRVVDALDQAFYLAFKNVVPTGKNILLALDVSASMTSPLNNNPLSCREACAALALVTANVEPKYHIVGFTAGTGHTNVYGRSGRTSPISDLAISPKQRLTDVVEYMDNLGFGGTDCALPMMHARQNKWNVDAFCIYTDSETWAGSMHPMQALNEYRAASGVLHSKLIVTGMTATEFTIADPNDPDTLDVVGFDTEAPAVLAEFIRG